MVIGPGPGVHYTLVAALARGAPGEGALAVEGDAAPRSAAKVVVSGILIDILDPKLTIFFFAFLPQFVSATAPDALGRLLASSAVSMLATCVVFVVYGLCAAVVRKQVLSRPRVMAWIRRVFAGAFVALGARPALAER